MFFLIMYLVLRIIPHWFNSADIITSKVVLSIALIFFFYRLLGIYLPISPTLGPMLVRMNRMVGYTLNNKMTSVLCCIFHASHLMHLQAYHIILIYTSFTCSFSFLVCIHRQYEYWWFEWFLSRLSTISWTSFGCFWCSWYLEEWLSRPYCTLTTLWG